MQSGKYVFAMTLAETQLRITILARKYYTGAQHVTLTTDAGDYVIPKTVDVKGEDFSFAAKIADTEYLFCVKPEGENFTVTARNEAAEVSAAGTVAAITPGDDRREKVHYKYRALILYSSMTGNTEKIAVAMKEALEHYCFQVDLMKITSKLNIPRDFSSYDLVCLGSLIIAGSPTKVVSNKLSLGGGAGAPTGDPADRDKKLHADMDFSSMLSNDGKIGDGGNTPVAATYPGGPSPRGIYHPLGVVFTTYGGGFYGSNEASATLELLKLYLEVQNVTVVGKFACCGKETGPAGLRDGEIPKTFGNVKLDAPVYYQDADENYHAGSFFFHTHMETKPCARDIDKARYLISDLVEDYFFTNDGMRREPGSQYISIS